MLLYALLIVDTALILIGGTQLHLEWQRVRRHHRLRRLLRQS
jgi:hypothetical protein